MGCLLYKSPKFYNYTFLFVGLTNLIGWFIKFSVQTFQPLIVIYKRIILFIIIRDTFQLIGHCLIPLDPCLNMADWYDRSLCGKVKQQVLLFAWKNISQASQLSYFNLNKTTIHQYLYCNCLVLYALSKIWSLI